MKKVAFIPRQVLPFILVFAMISLSSGLLKAQDTLAKKPHKVIKIKVDSDEGGESFTIDTTFVIDNDLDMAKFQKAMQKYEMKMQDMENYLEELELELDGEEMEKAIQEAQFEIQKACLHSPRMRYHYRTANEPRYYEQYGRRGNWKFAGQSDLVRDPVRIVAPKRGETLSDVLGDIPMNAVTSYKIKETKNGKRITIEVSDDAIFNHDENIIIWKQGDEVFPPPPPPPPPPTQPQLKKEVFIEQNVEKEETPEEPVN
ncbi:MAG: hypothetical protein JXA23_08800 [Bacteroidales bacterium]|nr:hypothetical protein [Bacteroidales bacterium]